MDLQKKKRSDFDEEEAVAVGDISVLGNDLLHEILLRLPPPSLLSSISVSKSWLLTYSSPIFHHHYRSRSASSLIGFFVSIPCRSPFFVPSLPLPVAVAELGSAQILDSRGGWLLLRDFATSSLRLTHPFISQTLAIPQPSLQNPTPVFHVLLPDPFSFNPVLRFRIVRVSKNTSSPPMIEVFSSESPGEWKQIQSSDNIRMWRCFSELHPVLVNGFVHWLNGERQILTMDEKNYDLSILGLPRELPLYITNHWLGKFNERLCYAYVEESVLYVWVLIDRCYCEWQLEHRFEAGRFRELGQFNDARLIAFGVGGSLNALFLGSMGKIFSLDLKNGELRKICSAGLDVDHVVPYKLMEAEWPFSSSMLGCETLL